MTTEDPHLIVYQDKSIYVTEDGNQVLFSEGRLSYAGKQRLSVIRSSLRDGFLEDVIEECKDPQCNVGGLEPAHSHILETLVESIRSQYGRAIVGLTVLQLCVKCISPDQSVRLHKGSARSGTFSWEEGIPMRVLDKDYITPTLRRHGLLSLNADGFMMTRTLAENYPYSRVYKAAIRGARKEWLRVVDLAEDGELDPMLALRKIIVLLHQRSQAFQELAAESMDLMHEIIDESPSWDEVFLIIKSVVDNSDYSARVFEIALHSYMQALENMGAFIGAGELESLSQMRSANKKHGNVGDIEVTADRHSNQILEAWDAKYGKVYLRDELDELDEKLQDHPETERAGFIVDRDPDMQPEILDRIAELEDLHGVEIKILSFEDWIQMQFELIDEEPDELACEWLRAFTESLCQRRRDLAPIDEPSFAWVQMLNTCAIAWMAIQGK